jgi:hypothetical protein
MQIRIKSSLALILAVSLGMIFADYSNSESELDIHSQESKIVYGSPEWNKAAKENISVRIVSVLQRPDSQLSWINERDLLQLKPEEKEAIRSRGVKGQLEVVSTDGRGSGLREVRMVIIQGSPLKQNARLPVPESGSAIYIENGGKLEPLFTNSTPSALTLEIYQDKTDTIFFMDYPRDRVRCGGGMFRWDENGNFHGI